MKSWKNKFHGKIFLSVTKNVEQNNFSSQSFQIFFSSNEIYFLGQNYFSNLFRPTKSFRPTKNISAVSKLLRNYFSDEKYFCGLKIYFSFSKVVPRGFGGTKVAPKTAWNHTTGKKLLNLFKYGACLKTCMEVAASIH